MFLNNKGKAMEKTHPENRHHIHSLRDLEDLMTSQGFTVGESKDDGHTFSVISKERVPHYPGTRPAMTAWVTSDKELQVRRNDK